METRDASRLLTAQEWEESLGRGIRDLRLRQNLTQAEVARRANVDRTTVTRIEHGDGGSIKSLVQIVRALGRDEWLESLSPPAPTLSPMQLLRAQQREEKHQRVRARPGSSTR